MVDRSSTAGINWRFNHCCVQCNRDTRSENSRSSTEHINRVQGEALVEECRGAVDANDPNDVNDANDDDADDPFRMNR